MPIARPSLDQEPVGIEWGAATTGRRNRSAWGTDNEVPHEQGWREGSAWLTDAG
jgi:hypothetical protein